MLYELKENIQRLQYATSAGSQGRRKRLREDRREFTVVSNDCWAAEVYKDFGLSFTTPFIGVYIAGPCFMKLAEDFERIVTSPLRFVRESKYPGVAAVQARKVHPTGLLDDGVEIHFLHFDSPGEAAAKWARRVERIDYEQLFFKLSADSDFPFTDDELRRFDALPLDHKLILTKRRMPELTSAVTMPDYNPDGKLNYELSLKYFDIVDWLNAG